MDTVAMFPLGKVLVPGEVLPLHVFEPRYRQLVVDLLADDDHPPEFGVVLIERGWEVGGGDARAGVGTMARIVDVQAMDGGRYGLVTVGTRRVRVSSWLDDDPYPRAEVDDWPDEPAGDGVAARVGAVAGRIGDLYARAADAAAAGGGEVPPPPEIPADATDPVLASYRLTALAPIGPADAYRALCAAGPDERLDVLDAGLDDVEAVLRFRLEE